ncbi:hypothetical protein [Flavonifractor sp. An306]|uniref:hypothetical protein n=1 Tax=Flavonifractor sp. An306 TaxID=1965629 RepID=UPI00174E1A13|nr:hypothetical protein [Flavonifractor sp. An306]
MTDDKRKIINFQPDDLDRQSNAENSDTRAGNKGVGSSDDDMSDEVNSAVQSKIKGDKQKLLEVELPTALAEREIKLYLSAILTGLLSVVGSITLMSVGLLVLLALAAFFIYTALSSRMDFRDGKIVERSLLCYNVQRAARVSADRYVSFCTSDEIPTYYRFRIKDKKATFFPGCPYLVYYHERNPELLIAYYQI